MLYPRETMLISPVSFIGETHYTSTISLLCSMYSFSSFQTFYVILYLIPSLGDHITHDWNLSAPSFLTLTKNEPSGKILVSDRDSNYIKMFSQEGKYIGRFCGARDTSSYRGHRPFIGIPALWR